MSERNIGFKVDEEFYKQIKIKLANEGKTLKEYVIELIKKDLEKNRNSSLYNLGGLTDCFTFNPK